MINTDVVRNSIKASKLSELEEIFPNILKAMRIDERGQPYAVYFFDIADDVDDRYCRLEQFQNEVIGPNYFQSSGDMRWNHYLYILAQ